MNDPIYASPKEDLVIAEAIGYTACLSFDGNCICHDVEGTFRPTTDINDARDAAEAVGLFSIDGHCAVLSKTETPDGEKWSLWYLDGDCGGETVYADTMELVICEAIKAINHEKPPSDLEIRATCRKLGMKSGPMV